MSLSVVIVNYNTRKLLKGCLESVFKHTKDLDFEVIVVDNASRDGSAKMVRKIIKDGSFGKTRPLIKLIESKKNLGFAGGNNLGIKQARGDYILLLNSDTLLKENAFLKMVDYMDGHPGVSILGPRLLNVDGSHQKSVGWFPALPVVALMLFKEHFGGSHHVRSSPEKAGEVDWVMGAALMARKDVFGKIGLLDEKIFMYMEEVEWCYRAKKAAQTVYFYPGAQITHLWQGSSKTGRKDPILNIYKGLIYFYRKHQSPAQLLVLLFLLKLKSGSAYLLGVLTGNDYLKETYGQAFKIS